MMPTTPSIDPTRPSTYHPDEAPTRRIRHAPDEAITRRRAPTPHGSPIPRQIEPLPPRQGGASAPQQAGYLLDQQGRYAAPQQDQTESPLLPQGSYPAHYMAAPLPHYEGYPPQQQMSYPPAQPAYPSVPGANMSLVAGQRSPGASLAGPGRAAPSIQYFYSPSVQPTTGASNQPGSAAFGLRGFWHDLSLLGQVAGVGGCFLLSLFFLPWFFTPDFTSGNVGSKSNTPTVSYSGWHTASGLPIFDRTSSFNLFPHLWLVLVCSLALIALAALLGVRRIDQRPAALLASAIALFVLLLEFLFLIQANSIQAAVEAASGEKLNQTLYGVAWGFWLAVAATIVVLGVGGFTLLRAYAPGTGNTSRTPGGSGQHLYPTL